MACYRPVSGYRGADGIVRSSAFALSPKEVKVPCGHCVGCALERSRQLALRCMHESYFHEQNSFVTLTYDEKNLPPGGELDKREWQKFAKRLRYRVGPFRFLACGEYGSLTNRPHFHAVVFGADFRGDGVTWAMKEGARLWTSGTLSLAWPKGLAVVADFSYATAAYVARYCMKALSGRWVRNPAEGTRVDRETGEVLESEPEFQLMSRNPGLGRTYYEKYGKELYRNDFCIHDGVKVRPPKYYDTLLEREDPERLAELKAKRVENAEQWASDQTEARLAVRERVKRAQIERLCRDLE